MIKKSVFQCRSFVRFKGEWIRYHDIIAPSLKQAQQDIAKGYNEKVRSMCIGTPAITRPCKGRLIYEYDKIAICVECQ